MSKFIDDNFNEDESYDQKIVQEEVTDDESLDSLNIDKLEFDDTYYVEEQGDLFDGYHVVGEQYEDDGYDLNLQDVSKEEIQNAFPGGAIGPRPIDIPGPGRYPGGPGPVVQRGPGGRPPRPPQPGPGPRPPQPGPRPPQPGPGPRPPRPPQPGPGPRPPRPPQPGPGPRPPRPPQPGPGPRPPRPPQPGPRPPRPWPMPGPGPRPIPFPYPIPIIITPGGLRPGQIFRPLNVYLCRLFDSRYGRFVCYYSIGFADSFDRLPNECRTFVAGPFRTIEDAERYINRAFGVNRGELFFCD